MDIVPTYTLRTPRTASTFNPLENIRIKGTNNESAAIHNQTLPHLQSLRVYGDMKPKHLPRQVISVTMHEQHDPIVLSRAL